MAAPFVRVIRPSRGWQGVDFGELWRHRLLLRMLIKRDVFGKYRQSVLGFTWAFIPPLAQMVVFTLIFGNVARLGPEGIPYYIFSFVALLPWNYFARALQTSSNSLLAGQALLTKVYFPRLVLPMTGALGSLIDLAIGMVVLLPLMLFAGIAPTWRLLVLPVFIFIALMTALGAGFWLTALSVRYRDVSFALPFFISLWMFVTPVIFAVEKIPQQYQLLLWLNPMTGVIEGFRWSLLGLAPPAWPYMALSLGIVAALLVTGGIYFRTMERTFADVI
jgi:lipopolysaccharide transport system permease protein